MIPNGLFTTLFLILLLPGYSINANPSEHMIPNGLFTTLFLILLLPGYSINANPSEDKPRGLVKVEQSY